jgi:mono/diheme cytochrome c family protein
MNDETTDRGREREDREQATLNTGQAWAFGFGAGAVVLALLVFAFMIGYNRGQDEAGGKGGGEPAAAKPQAEGEVAPVPGGPGEDLFVESCGSCHTLAAAGTSGTSGPDLDALALDEQQVMAAIDNGGTGSGAMPAGLLQGQDAQAVAEYVAGAADR